jgi:biopolymer transport protein ExbD
MGSVEGAGPRGHDKKKGKKKKKAKRIGIRIDNTPMVDIAFLLLTFFMLTTTMNRPQTMEINLPPSNDVTVEVAESNLMTIRVKEEGTIYWNIAKDTPEKVEFSALRALMAERNTQNPKLITLIKIDRKGKYKMMVDIMDELNLANVTRFSLAPMEEGDMKILETLL